MTILVLDASATVRSKIESLLIATDIDNLDICQFEDGESAIDFIDSNDVDIIFSGIEIKGIDGVSFADLILRGKPEMVPRLFIVTSQTNTTHLEEIKEVGAKRFIKKPISDEYFNHFVIPEIKKLL